jgi:hypothetical protein
MSYGDAKDADALANQRRIEFRPVEDPDTGQPLKEIQECGKCGSLVVYASIQKHTNWHVIAERTGSLF